MLPAERAPTQRAVDTVPEEGVVAVEDVVQMGELVASMQSARQAEQAAYGYDDDEGDYGDAPDAPPMDFDMNDALPDAPPDAPPDDDDE